MVECSVTGCQKAAHSRTYCHMHYRRWYINDDLLSGRPKDWGKKRNHPLYFRWGQVKKRISLSHPWRDFWTFLNDVGKPPEGVYALWPKDKNKTIGSDNFYWKEQIISTDRNDYARKWRRANPDKVKDKDLRKCFGINLIEYNRLLNEQNGKCAICKNHCNVYRNLSVDHCHDTGKVRGLLCSKCNQAIGCFKEDKNRMKEAINYLEKNG